MKTIGMTGWVVVLTVFAVVTAQAAPVDHVYVSSNKVDMLNLDGTLNKQFLPGSADGICRGLAVDGNTGNVWLACETKISPNNRLYLFDSNGNILRQCSDTPQFCDVVMLDKSICIDPSGNAWINDRVNNQVYKYSSTGTRSGPYSTGAGTQPWAIACDKFGNIWTANNSTNNVSKLTSTGSFLASYSVSASPRGIATDAQGNILVTTNSGFLDKLDNNGILIGHYGSGALYGYGIAIDQNQNAWITQPFYKNIVKLSASGLIIGTFSCGTGSTDVSIDASGYVFVTNRNDSTVTKLANNGSNSGLFSLSSNSGQNDTGFLHKHFVLGYNSVDGPNVWVPLNGGAPAGAVTLNFDYITAKGNTSYAESGTGTPAPSGFKLGSPPRYYDITSTTSHTGNIEVCIGYNQAEFNNEANLRLFHNDGIWTNVTSSVDTTNNIVCGVVTNLSEFAVMEADEVTPTVSEWILILMAATLFIAIAHRFKKTASLGNIKG